MLDTFLRHAKENRHNGFDFFLEFDRAELEEFFEGCTTLDQIQDRANRFVLSWLG